MKKTTLFSILLIILVAALVSAHEDEADHATAINNSFSEDLGLFPTEIPTAGTTTILSFQVSNTEFPKVSHIDSSVTISDAEGNILKENELIHTHGNAYSMIFKFPKAGEYTIQTLIEPSDHYEGTQFDPVIMDFIIEVAQGEKTSSGASPYLLGASIIIILGLIFLIWKKKKK
ncbi:hypothetical protein HZA98_00870 [Candidatus Woesearchaeota archaeon]|nr:hypothetical protein [Candidatus Woesearchaeota archaeon]